MNNEKKESLDFLLEKSEKVFSRNLSNMDKIDSKFIQLLVFITAILFFSIQFIDIPEGDLYFWLYICSILCFFLAIILIFLGYRTRKYKAIDMNNFVKNYISRKRKSEIELKKDVIGFLSYRVNDIKKINSTKGKYFDWSAIFICIGILLILIVKFFGGTNG